MNEKGPLFEMRNYPLNVGKADPNFGLLWPSVFTRQAKRKTNHSHEGWICQNSANWRSPDRHLALPTQYMPVLEGWDS